MDNYRNVKGFYRYMLIALIGAIIGGLIVGSVFIYYLDTRQTDNNTISSDLINAESSGDTTLPQTESYQEPTTIEAVAKLVTPTVVGVQTVEVTQDVFMRQYESTGVGSGVIITEDGYILTNHHVVTDNPKSVTVSLKDGSIYPATTIWSDETLDLAVIKIDATGLTTATLGNSENIAVGQTAIAIGNPLGLTFERTVTAGIISAMNRSIPISENTPIAEDLIQTDASINQGNSGGPLLNARGEVIGINTYKINAEGMGFAIPINIAKPIVSQIIKNGEFQETVIGIVGLDKEIASYYEDVTLDSGILISSITSGYGAENAGLKVNDIIVSVDNIEVNTMLKLREVLYSKLPGDTVEVKYTRNGNENTTTVSLMGRESE